MPIGYGMLRTCVNEIEQELLRVGRDRCEHLTQQTQLAAVILLQLRSVSLFRSMVNLLEVGELDAFDAVRRAFFEAWNLAFQFRLNQFHSGVARWFARENGSWSARIGQLEEYARGRGHRTPNLGRDYGMLSEIAHPTRNAAENSAALVISRHANNPEVNTIEEAKARLEDGIDGILYRIIWLATDEHDDFMDIPIEEEHMPTSVRFAENYPHV